MESPPQGSTRTTPKRAEESTPPAPRSSTRRANALAPGTASSALPPTRTPPEEGAEAEHARALAVGLRAIGAAAALFHAAAGLLVCLAARDALGSVGTAVLHTWLACVAARHALALLAALALGGVALDGAAGAPRGVAEALRALRVCSALGAGAGVVALAAHLPTSALYALSALLGALEVQAVAWAALLVAPAQPGGVLALLPARWMQLACETDALALLQASSRCVSDHWSMLELWWGSIMINLTRAEVDECLAAGAVPRALYRLLHQPLLALLPAQLLAALTADPAAGLRAAIAHAVRAALPATLARAAAADASASGARAAGSATPARGASAAQPDSPPLECVSSSSASSERETPDGVPCVAPPAERALAVRPPRARQPSVNGGLLLHSAGISAFIVRVLATRLLRWLRRYGRTLLASVDAQRARAVRARLVGALATAAALTAVLRRRRAPLLSRSGAGLALAVGAAALAGMRSAGGPSADTHDGPRSGARRDRAD